MIRSPSRALRRAARHRLDGTGETSDDPREMLARRFLALPAVRRGLRLPLLVGLAALAPRAVAEAPAHCAGGDCFAVFVMPDTQGYVHWTNNFTPARGGRARFDGEGAARLEAIARWICKHRSGWPEPGTGKAVRIELVLQLGDLVQSNGVETPEPPGGCAGNRCEWERVGRAFDVLDACGMRYLAVPGNHDLDTRADAGAEDAAVDTTDRFTARFAAEDLDEDGDEDEVRPPWRAASTCPGLRVDGCDWARGAWFLGGGDDDAPEAGTPPGNQIPRGSRRFAGFPPGPASDQAGRHRAGMIESPGGTRVLFLGLEFSEGLLVASSREWPRRLLEANPDVPTVIFNHQGFDETIFEDLVARRPQVFVWIRGHLIGLNSLVWYPPPPTARPKAPARSGAASGRAEDVHRVAVLTRNYQHVQSAGMMYGAGLNAIAIVDPKAGAMRFHTLRIDGDPDPRTGRIVKVRATRECAQPAQGDCRTGTCPGRCVQGICGQDECVAVPLPRLPHG